MKKNYFFMAAASALLLASCSNEADAPKNPEENASESVTLKTLNAASQSKRVARFGTTRGVKADRLQLVAKIAPVADASDFLWSATGVSIENGTAYISWHSNRQATESALAWGGAIDMIDLESLTITKTQTTSEMKFNNVVAKDGVLYFPMTSWKKGAAVGRLAVGEEVMDTLSIYGSSVNHLAVNSGDIYAVSGYNGGVFKFPANFENGKHKGVVDTLAMNQNFGGKFIDGKYVLRTDANKSYLFNCSTKESRELGAPLVSEEKYGEYYRYDEALGKHVWVVETGEKATYYGKHTMAFDYNSTYFYVAGGKGADGKNGIRVYDLATGELAWENGINTTAVCLDDNYVYAATGSGLRVYEKFNGEALPLYAYEVGEYDAEGNAVGSEEGTSAHSTNFVAVDSESGLIFVANGQSGVYVFKLNHNASAE